MEGRRSYVAVPTKAAVREYDPAFAQWVRDLGKSGSVPVQIAKHLGTTLNQLKVWRGTHPEFHDAMEHAHDLALAHWVQQGIDGMANKNFNQNVYRQFMSTHFPDYFRDKPPEQIEMRGLLARLDVGRLDDRTLVALADKPLETLLNMASDRKALPKGEG